MNWEPGNTAADAEKMDKAQAMLEKAAMQHQTTAPAGYDARGGALCGGPALGRLSARVDAHLHGARQDAQRADRLQELQYLLQLHPDVARILDLLEVETPGAR